MDKYPAKRGATGSMVPRKRYNVGFKDANTSRDQDAQFCNRIGCHGRIKYSNQDTKIGCSDKGKCSKPTFCSSDGNEVGSSSRSGSAITRAKRSYLDTKRKLSSKSGCDTSVTSQSVDSEASQQSSSPDRNPEKIGSSSVQSNIRPRKMFQPKSGSNTQASSSVLNVSRSSGLGTVNGSNNSRCLKNLKCNSISDVVPSNCSSSVSKSSVKNVMKKSSPEGEGNLSIRRTLTSGVSGSGSGSRRSSFTSGGDSSSAASVRTGRSSSYVNQNRMRFSYQQNVRTSSRGVESTVRISRFPGSEPPVNVGRPILSRQFSANGSSSSYSLSSSNDDDQSTLIPFTSAELGFSYLLNRDPLQHYNMEGIAEVLLALERIEQDQEMTHEQILALETSLFLSGLNLYDQHRDMRLDIDNMSYEELLALGERMGTVSTALSEEALLKCVRRSTYKVTQSEERFTESGEDGDDVKCSICQEEYERGDEIGKLVECSHAYHMGCIHEWLRHKNWCPICKTPAAPPHSSSSP